MFDRNENKKMKKAKNTQYRVMVGFNTGTRTMKSKKDYDRAKEKKMCRQALMDY